MKGASAYIAVAVATAFCFSSAWAVPPGKIVEFEGGGMGKVVFEGKLHADRGLKCNDCHPKIFPMRKNSVVLTMTDVKAGKYCGACHNGTKAFKTADAANCARCHKKHVL